MGQVCESYPEKGPGYRQIRRSKDRAPAEFPFLSFSHKLEAGVRKENAMSTIVLALLLIARVVFPIGALIALGEWIRRREENYWLRN